MPVQRVRPGVRGRAGPRGRVAGAPRRRTRFSVGPVLPATARAGLTTRAAALALVVCALVVSGALPLREYLAQRGRVAAAEQDQGAARSRVAALQQQQRLLGDPAYVAALARERLHFVRPGETTYVVLGQEPAPSGPTGPAQPAAEADTPWWTQLSGSVRSADHPMHPVHPAPR